MCSLVDIVELVFQRFHVGQSENCPRHLKRVVPQLWRPLKTEEEVHAFYKFVTVGKLCMAGDAHVAQRRTQPACSLCQMKLKGSSILQKAVTKRRRKRKKKRKRRITLHIRPGLSLCCIYLPYFMHFHLWIVNGIMIRYVLLHGERKRSRSHAIVLVRLRCLLLAASVLCDPGTFCEYFTTRFLPLFMELLDRRGATACSASAGFWVLGWWVLVFRCWTDGRY